MIEAVPILYGSFDEIAQWDTTGILGDGILILTNVRLYLRTFAHLLHGLRYSIEIYTGLGC